MHIYSQIAFLKSPNGEMINILEQKEELNSGSNNKLNIYKMTIKSKYRNKKIKPRKKLKIF